MAGLIQTQLDQQDPMKATGYDAERIELDPKTDTVEGRVEGIISKNSPLMQSAATRANQQSNRRGLLNSSMAVGAGQRAVIDAATPIASQDAQTSFQAKGLNQQAGNRALEFGAGSANQFGLQGLSGQQALEQIGAQGEQELGIIERQGQMQMARDTLLNQFQTQQNELERQFQGEENSAQRDLERERLARTAATELMRQVAGQNATFTDGIAQINASDLAYGDKSRLINAMTDIHLNQVNHTLGLMDFDIVDGKVTYSGGSGGSGDGASPANPTYESEQERIDRMLREARDRINGNQPSANPDTPMPNPGDYYDPGMDPIHYFIQNPDATEYNGAKQSDYPGMDFALINQQFAELDELRDENGIVPFWDYPGY